jgi:hypothetical protein
VAVENRVADSVDATVDPVQPPALHPPGHRVAVESDLVQLADGDNAVLRGSELREAQITVRGC